MCVCVCVCVREREREREKRESNITSDTKKEVKKKKKNEQAILSKIFSFTNAFDRRLPCQLAWNLYSYKEKLLMQ